MGVNSNQQKKHFRSNERVQNLSLKTWETWEKRENHYLHVDVLFFGFLFEEINHVQVNQS